MTPNMTFSVPLDTPSTWKRERERASHVREHIQISSIQHTNSTLAMQITLFVVLKLDGWELRSYVMSFLSLHTIVKGTLFPIATRLQSPQKLTMVSPIYYECYLLLRPKAFAYLAHKYDCTYRSTGHSLPRFDSYRLHMWKVPLGSNGTPLGIVCERTLGWCLCPHFCAW